MTNLISIGDAMSDPQLLGSALGDESTWKIWTAVLKAAFGERLTAAERTAFHKVAGARRPPKRRVSELWAIVGRRGGKSRMAAVVATYLGCLTDHTGKLAKGEIGEVMVLSSSVRQARLVFRYIKGFIDASPLMRGMVAGETNNEIRLVSNITISVHTNSFRTVRGPTMVAMVFDESGFWRDENAAEPDLETYRAVLPGLATTDGMLVGISSPYRQVGLLYNKHRESYGVDDEDVLVVQGKTELFNPTINRKVVERARSRDPEAAKSEWDGEFRTDLQALLDEQSVEEAVDAHRPLEVARRPGIVYHAFVDASAGKHDAFCIGIGHAEDMNGNDGFVADVVRGRKPPFNPGSVAAEYAKLAKSYGCETVIGDAYAGEWVAQAFRDGGCEYRRCDMVKSGLYLESVAPFNQGLVSIPKIPLLIRELKLLQRRTARSGKDSVDHPVGGSDDYANVVAGCMRAALAKNHWDVEPVSAGPRVYVRAKEVEDFV